MKNKVKNSTLNIIKIWCCLRARDQSYRIDCKFSDDCGTSPTRRTGQPVPSRCPDTRSVTPDRIQTVPPLSVWDNSRHNQLFLDHSSHD